MRNIIIAFFLLTLGLNLFSQGVIYINEAQSDGLYDLTGNVFYLIDSADQFTFEEILSHDFESKFTQAEYPVFSYRMNGPSQWYKIRIENNTGQIQQLILGLNNPLISDITFYNTFDSVYYYTGFFYPFNQRQVIFNNYLFKIKAQPGQQGIVCFKVNSQLQPAYLPISLMTEKLATNKLRINAFTEGVFYCVFVFLLFIIVVLGNSEKEKSYFFLFVLVVLMGLASLWRDGFLFQFLWPNLPHLNYKVGRVIYSLLVFSLLAFEFSFFKIKKTHRNLSLVVKLGLLTTFIFGLSQFFISQYVYFYYGIRLIVVFLAIVTFWGIYITKRLKIPFHGAYSLGFVIIITDFLIRLFLLNESQGFGFYDTQISTFVTILFYLTITYVFISKFKGSRIEVIDLNKNLEQLVEKRTFQLNAQKEELTAQHEELVQQKETLQTQREELRAKTELLELNNMELAKLSLVASKTDNLIYIFLPNGELDWFNTSFSHRIGITLEEYHRGNPLSIIDVSTNRNIRHVLKDSCILRIDNRRT
jgi:hypothetical protein